MTPNKFIDRFAGFAMDASRRHGIPASVQLAQAALETGWGEHPIAVYNLFGMKGVGPAGTTVTSTHEVENGKELATRAGFQVFHNYAEAFDAHARLLATDYRYAAARLLLPNVTAFVNVMGPVYATDPKSAEKILSIIRSHGLERFDQPVEAAGQPDPPNPPVERQPDPTPPASDASRPWWERILRLVIDAATVVAIRRNRR